MENDNPHLIHITAADYGDIMIDLETTGTSPDRHGILQIAAVRFDLDRRWVCPKVFEARLTLPKHRHWDEGTRSWWLKDETMAATLADILQRQEDWREVMLRFQQWVGGSKPRFWSKPSHFDFMFLQSYFTDAEVHNPFHYRDATDLNSWIRARYWPQKPAYHENNIGEFDGSLHNALDDVFHQIKLLFKVADHTQAPPLT